ncbi:MAG: hypothetical protein R6X22_09100 [Gemmatimonadota bacterium]
MTGRRRALVPLAAMLAVAVLVAPARPFPILAVPFALLLLGLRYREPFGVAAALLLLGLVFGPGPGPGEAGGWHLLRGWCLLTGGLFVALCSAGRPTRLLDRSLAAVGTATCAVTALALARPAFGAALDAWMEGQIGEAASAARALLAVQPGEDPASLSSSMSRAIETWAGFQLQVYPALLGLATAAALSVAWYFARRGDGDAGPTAPPRVREFAFRDELIWVLVGGLALLVLPLGAAAFRIGENATMFMGALYLVRGAAILGWVASAAVTSAWSWALIGIGAVLAYPVVAGAALVLGVGDTWLHVRERLRVVGLNGSGR